MNENRQVIRDKAQLAAWMSKFEMSLNYIFGKGSTRYLDRSILSFQISPKTGRLRYVLLKENGEILFSFRSNGSIAPSLKGAKCLLQWTTADKKRGIRSRPRWIITVTDEVSQVIAMGKTLFCKHVKHVDESLRPIEDVAIMNESGQLIAVGRSIVSGPTMKQFKRGAAVKVRQGSNVSDNVPTNELRQ